MPFPSLIPWPQLQVKTVQSKSQPQSLISSNTLSLPQAVLALSFPQSITAITPKSVADQFMAAGKIPSYFSPHLIGSNSSRTGAPFSVRISSRSSGFLARAERGSLSVLDEAPSCIFVGPIETANKETLEALYRQVK